MRYCLPFLPPTAWELPLLAFESMDRAVPARYGTFALEGAAETAASLARLGIGYLFHDGPPAPSSKS